MSAIVVSTTSKLSDAAMVSAPISYRGWCRSGYSAAKPAACRPARLASSEHIKHGGSADLQRNRRVFLIRCRLFRLWHHADIGQR